MDGRKRRVVDCRKFRDRFTVERLTPTQGESNEVAVTARPAGQFWGQLKSLSGRQVQMSAARAVASTATYMVGLRYRDDLDVTSTRLTLRSPGGAVRRFRINAIDDVDNRHVEMELVVTEVVGATS